MRGFLAVAVALALVTVSRAAPVVDQSNVVSQSVGGVYIYSGSSPAQRFTAGAGGLLSQVDVLLRRSASDIGELSLNVWPVSTQGPAGATPLYSASIDPADVPFGTDGFVAVDVSPAGISVAPGEQYAISVSGSAPLGDGASWTRGLANYAAGDKWDYDGSWYTDGDTYDYGFRTWVDQDAVGLEQLVLTPIIDAQVQAYSSGVLIGDISGDSIYIDQETQNGADSRGFFEYDASALPAGAQVQSAQFTFDTTLLNSGSSESPVLEFHGYQGDGQYRASNVQNLNNPVGTSQPISEFGTSTVSLDAGGIASLAGGPGSVGLAVRGTNALSLGIASSEYASRVPSFYTAPTLTIGYVSESETEPPPAPLPAGDYNGDARVDAADYTVWRDAQQTPGDLRADGDQDGDVDQADYDVWRNAFGTSPDPDVANGGFETLTLAGWDVGIDLNTSVSSGFPRVEFFDVDGDGSSGPAMRLRLGRADTDQFGGRVTIEQELLLEGGDYELSADVASQSLDFGGNTGPGNFELSFDGVVVDQVLLNGTLIEASEVIRDSLRAVLLDVQPGYHTLGIAISRGATNSRSIYQFVDDITLTAISPSQAVPEPGTLALLLLGALGPLRSGGRR